MVRKLGLAALMLLLIPTLATAGLIYASTPTTSPVRGTVSPSGYVSGANPFTYFTITANSGYMINSVTLDNVPLYPITTPGPNQGKYPVPYKTTTQRLLAAFLPVAPEQLKAVLPATVFVSPGTPFTISGSASIVVLNWGKLATYTWSVSPSGPTLSPTTGTTSNAADIKTNFTGSTPGPYQVTLKISAPGLADSSAVANVIVQSNNIAASKTCLTCHQSNSVLVYTASAHALDSTKPQYGSTPTCYTCHNPTTPPMPHPGYPLKQVVNVCVTCHQQGTLPPELSFHNDFYSTPDICVTCHNKHSLAVDPAKLPPPHFNPITSYSNPGYTAMYVTPRTPKCNYCHGTPLRFQHNTTAAAQARSQWAKSGKGDVNAQPWKNAVGYDWKTRGTANASAATTTSQDCVRCHVAAGFVQYVGSNFTNISPVGVASDKTSEPLTCNGCHNTDSTTNPGFTVRSVGPVTAYYNYSSTKGKVLVSFNQFYAINNYTMTPVDNRGSNTCIPCHAGRASGNTIKAADATGVDFNNLSFINSHYFTAAGTLFNATGYTYPGKDYSNTFFFVHYKAGTDAPNVPPGTGDNGPCVSCHMMSPKKHSYAAITKDQSGTITAIDTTACATCHGSQVTPSWLQAQNDGFTASLDFLQYMLQTKKNIFYSNVYPYFFKSASDTSTANAFKSWGNADTMGAAFNFNLLKREPGAYVHNPTYAKRLIWDSVDYLDDGIMNDSTATTLAGLSGESFFFNTVGYLDGARP